MQCVAIKVKRKQRVRGRMSQLILIGTVCHWNMLLSWMRACNEIMSNSHLISPLLSDIQRLFFEDHIQGQDNLSFSQDSKENKRLGYRDQVVFSRLTEDLLKEELKGDDLPSMRVIICGTRSFDNDMMQFVASTGLHADQYQKL